MLSEWALGVLEDRGLDVELADRLGFTSEVKGWPVAGEGGKTIWRDGEALVIPFIRDGKVVRHKFKRLVPIEGAPAYLQDKGGLRCVWNEDALRDPQLTGKPWILTEGELDAAAAIQCGFARSSSVPDGAPKDPVKGELTEAVKYAWVHELKPLLGKDNVPEIILATDGDEPGAALLHDLSVLFGRYRCKFVRYPKLPQAEADRLGRSRCKDLNEVLQFWGAKGVVETIGHAEWLKIDGVFRMSELPPKPPRPVFEVGYPRFGEHFKLRLGDFSVWTGIPSHGKSTFLNDLLCRASYDHGLVIAWASFEQEPQTDHRRYLRRWYIGHRRFHDERFDQDMLDGIEQSRTFTEAEIAEADAWIDRQHVFIYPSEDDDVTLDWFLEKAEAAVAQHGAKVVVGDPWNEMDHEYDARSQTEAQYINGAIKTLRRFARAFMIHLALVAHPTKLPKQQDGTYPMPGLYDINGGAVWHNKADLGVVVYREKDGVTTRVKTAKSRFHDVIGKPGSVLMQFCGEDRHFREVEGGGE